MFDWDAELTPERRDELIEQFAQEVTRRKLQVPAVLFLEMHKPLAYVASQSLVLGSGFLVPVLGPRRVQEIARLIENRSNVERLIRRIEELAA